MTIPDNLEALDAAAAAAQSDVDLLTASATNLRAFASAYATFAAILSAKTGTPVAGNYNAIKAALEGLPDPE